MGLIRKLASVSTLGAVDLRSDKERTARSTRQTAHESKEQTKLLRQQLEQQQAAATRQTVTPTTGASGPQGTVADRIIQLDGLLTASLITNDEYAKRRAEILAAI